MRKLARLACVGVALVGCLAAPLAPVHASGNADNSAQLASIRAVTDQYRSFGASQADGFTFLVTNQSTQETCISNGSVGAMGQHYVNPGRVGDGVIQRQRPEVLLYEPQANGSKVLVGVEYVVLVSDWVKHHSDPPVLFGTEFDLVTQNPFGLPPFYALHAWAWRDNPSGPFKAWNPAVSCP